MNTFLRLFIVITICTMSLRGFAAAARITDLSVSVIRGESATVQWTAPTSSVALVRYDIRISDKPITALNWSSTTSLVPETQWLYNDVQYQANLVTNGYTYVVYMLPEPGSVLENRATFSWSPVQGATAYAIDVISNARVVAKYQVGTDTAASLPIPMTGAVITIRVWYRVAAVWNYTDFPYVAPSTASLPTSIVSVSPEPGSSITSPGKFSWNLVANAVEYWVELGSGVGGGDLYNKSTRKDNFVSIPNIPQDGRPLRLTVWWKVGTTWYSQGFDYGADFEPEAFGEIVGVESSSGLLVMSPTIFSWNPVIGADEYWVELGSTLGGRDLWNKSAGLDTSMYVRNIPQDGRDLFLRIWYKLISAVTRIPGSTEEMVISSLTLNKQYYVAVKTMDKSGVWSPISNVLSFETRLSSETYSIGLTWNQNSEANLAGYKLYRGTQPGQPDTVQDVGLSTVVASNGLEYGQTYYFTVTAYDDVGLESEPSNEIAVKM